MNQTTAIVLIAIEGAGLLITIGFGIAAFKAARKAKAAADEAKKKSVEIANAAKRFFTDVETILGN